MEKVSESSALLKGARGASGINPDFGGAASDESRVFCVFLWFPWMLYAVFTRRIAFEPSPTLLSTPGSFCADLGAYQSKRGGAHVSHTTLKHRALRPLAD